MATKKKTTKETAKVKELDAPEVEQTNSPEPEQMDMAKEEAPAQKEQAAREQLANMYFEYGRYSAQIKVNQREIENMQVSLHEMTNQADEILSDIMEAERDLLDLI